LVVLAIWTKSSYEIGVIKSFIDIAIVSPDVIKDVIFIEINTEIEAFEEHA
jgi:hypothetical protein